MSLSGLQKFHLEKCCIDNDIDFHEIDDTLDYHENKNHLVGISINKEPKFNEAEAEAVEIQNNTSRLEEFCKTKYENPSDFNWIWASCERIVKEPDGILLKQVKKWIYRQRAIEITTEKALRNKRRAWRISCKFALKRIL